MRKTRTRKAPIVVRREAARLAREHVAGIIRDAARYVLPRRYLLALAMVDELEQAALAAVRDHFRAARRRILDARASR